MLRALQFEGVEYNLEETYIIALFNAERDGFLESVGWLGKMQQLLVSRFVVMRVIRSWRESRDIEGNVRVHEVG